MTLLTIAANIAFDVGIEEPAVVVSSTDREVEELLAFINDAGVELARRVDWGALTTSATVTGDGTTASKTVNAAAMKLTSGVTATNSGGGIVRPLSRPEWNTLTLTEGTPRYFLLEGTSISFFPYLASADTCTVYYQTENWTDAGAASFAADTESPLFPEDILEKATIARWRRQKGMPYQDQEAEYEAALAQYADFDDRSRL